MNVKAIARRWLPRRLYAALAVYRHGMLAPGDVAELVPTMIVSAEAAYYAQCAREYAATPGQIVDLGCWMGGTAIALSQGLRQAGVNAGSGSRPILAFDLFTWDDRMPGELAWGVYRHGESFLPEARRNTGRHGGGLIELIPADLARYEWTGGPIKILLVDAMKSAALARQIARTFYPSLRPGGLLIHQDYKHYYTSWIHVLQYRLREHFRLHRSTRGHGTAGFEVLAAPSADEVARATEFDTISDEESEACFAFALGLLEESDRVNLAAAHVAHYHHLGRHQQARRTLDRYIAQGLAGKGEFPKVAALVGTPAPG